MTVEQQVAQLLRQAESTEFPEEAELFSARAERLMLKHGISRSMAEAAGQQEKDHITWFSISFDGIYAKAYVFAVHDIVTGFGNAKGYLTSFDKPKKGMSYHFCSFSKDGAELKALLDSLMIQCNAALAEHIEALDYAWSMKSGTEKYNDKRSFILGFGRETSRRIAATRQEVITEVKAIEAKGAPGTDIVLKNKSAEIEKAYDRMMGGSKRKARGMQTTQSGYRAGVAAGREASLGAGRKAVGR